MNKFRWAWTWLGLLVVLDIAGPWFLLSNMARITGAFLFWVVWAAIAITSVFVIFSEWREVKP